MALHRVLQKSLLAPRRPFGNLQIHRRATVPVDSGNPAAHPAHAIAGGAVSTGLEMSDRLPVETGPAPRATWILSYWPPTSGLRSRAGGAWPWFGLRRLPHGHAAPRGWSACGYGASGASNLRSTGWRLTWPSPLPACAMRKPLSLLGVAMRTVGWICKRAIRSGIHALVITAYARPDFIAVGGGWQSATRTRQSSLALADPKTGHIAARAHRLQALQRSFAACSMCSMRLGLAKARRSISTDTCPLRACDWQ